MHLVKMYLTLMQMPTCFEHTKFLPTTFDKNPNIYIIRLVIRLRLTLRFTVKLKLRFQATTRRPEGQTTRRPDDQKARQPGLVE